MDFNKRKCNESCGFCREHGKIDHSYCNLFKESVKTGDFCTHEEEVEEMRAIHKVFYREFKHEPPEIEYYGVKYA